jgi:hypothetical protein
VQKFKIASQDAFDRGTGQIFLTHGDSGHTQFNFSEVIGNSTAIAISTAYYSDNRTASDAVSKLGIQLGVDMGSNVLKEFWPDFERRLSRKHHQNATGTGESSLAYCTQLNAWCHSDVSLLLGCPAIE